MSGISEGRPGSGRPGSGTGIGAGIGGMSGPSGSSGSSGLSGLSVESGGLGFDCPVLEASEADDPEVETVEADALPVEAEALEVDALEVDDPEVETVEADPLEAEALGIDALEVDALGAGLDIMELGRGELLVGRGELLEGDGGMGPGKVVFVHIAVVDVWFDIVADELKPEVCPDALVTVETEAPVVRLELDQMGLAVVLMTDVTTLLVFVAGHVSSVEDWEVLLVALVVPNTVEALVYAEVAKDDVGEPGT